MAKLVDVSGAPGEVRPPGDPGGPSSARTTIFYGWWIVLAGFGIMTIGGALLHHAFGAYVKVLEDEFGWSRTELAIAFSLQRVESGFLGPIQGWAVDRFGPRLCSSFGLAVFGLALLLFSQVHSLWAFYGVFTLVAIGWSFGSFLSISTSLVNWFSQRRALAIGLMSTGIAAGGVFTPAVVWSHEEFGWRTTAAVSGFIVWAVAIPLAQVIRHRPEDHGLMADGLQPKAHGGNGAVQPVSAEASFTASEAMRTRAFWLISLGHAAGLLTVGAISVHLFVHLTDEVEVSSAVAARLVAMMTVMLVFGMLIGGVLGDRMNKRLILVAAMFGHMSALLLLAVASQLALVTLAIALQGLAWGARGPLTAALRAEYFGPTSFGKIMGFSSLVVMTGMMAGPIIAGVMYDAQGDYSLAFTLLGLAAGAGSLCFAFATRPRVPGPAAVAVATG